MSTTDILFNSPALHSLKRAQLVQLCKRHKIKASGKNTELVSRLKEHAQNLPSGAPLSIAVRSETEPDGNGDGDGNDATGTMTDISDEDNVEDQLTSPEKERESQIWEVVSRGSLDSKRSSTTSKEAGEFGTATNTKPTILRSIASSIGLSRSPSNSNCIPGGDSSDSLAPPSNNKKDRRELSGSPKPRSIFSSFMPRNRTNSEESQSQPKAKGNARKSLLTRAIPYNKIPVPSASRRPQIEPFAFSYTCAEDTSLVSEMSIDTLDRPVPGIGPFIGVNVKNGLGTVRLITNTSKPPDDDDEIPNLEPVVPAFDLIPPTPGKPGPPRFPAATPEVNRTLYPTISSDDREIDLEVLTSPTKKPSKEAVDKSLPSLPELSPISPTSPKEPFIFGSPNPRHSTAAEDFSTAASSVLAEMNARLSAAGGRALDSKVIANGTGQRPEVDIEALMRYEFGGKTQKDKDKDMGKKSEGSLSKKFDKLHEKAFSKMEGIDKHYAAIRGMKDKDKAKEEEKLKPLPDNRKRKQSVLGTKGVKKNPVSGPAAKKQVAEVKAEAREKKKGAVIVIPGAFEQDDNDMEVDESVVRTEADVVAEADKGHIEEQEQHKEEENDRSAKRVCVEEPVPGGSGETRRISVIPKVRKNESDEEEEIDEEKKRKQNVAIKRRLEINKAKRRSSRGVVPRTPNQRQKGFLASAKSFVKSVWNRGGGGNSASTSSKINSGVPSYLKATASSAGKTLEQDAKPVPAPAQGPGLGPAPATGKPTVARASSVRSSSGQATTSGGGITRKLSKSQQNQQTIPKPGLETVKEGDAEKPSSSTVVQFEDANTKNSQTPVPGPISGSVQSRKPSASSSILRKPSVKGGPGPATSGSAPGTTTAGVGTVGRSSRLLAPTASSLAKASPTKSTTVSRGSRVRGRASVMSPSRIPVFSPPNKNQATGTGAKTTPGSKRIFGTPLVLPSSPQAREAAGRGEDVNPITGVVSPSHARIPFSSANGRTQSLLGAATALASKKEATSGGKEDLKDVKNQNTSPTKVNKALNALRRPRISRSKVIARLTSPKRAPLGPTRTNAPAGASTSTTNPTSSSTNNNIRPVPTTPKIRSSTGVAVRRSLGGAKARDSTVSAVQLSAKKRVRTSEYARRKSAKSPIKGQVLRIGRPEFGNAIVNGEDVGMEVDD